MDLNFASKVRHRRCPDTFTSSFVSRSFVSLPNPHGIVADWVLCKFSENSDTLLYLGGNDGSVALFDVRNSFEEEGTVEGGILRNFAAHNGVIMDICSVPGVPNLVLTASGDSTVRLWDVNKAEPSSVLFNGHAATVRSACFSPTDSNVFITGGRDGQIRIWDTRMSLQKDRRTGVSYKTAANVYTNTHSLKQISTRKSKTVTVPPKVVSVLFLDENEIVSSSECASSGLRVWDIRKMPINDEGHVLRTLDVPITQRSKRNYGICSLALDRFKSSLFAAVTNNVIYEYKPSVSNEPIRSLNGASLNNFDIMLCTSPISDHVLCGTTDNHAAMWNLENYHVYMDDFETPEMPSPVVDPSYSMSGHDFAVTSVSWSCNGSYIVTMDELDFRVWSVDPSLREESIRKTFKEKYASSEFIETNADTQSIRRSKRISKVRKKMDYISPTKSYSSSPRKSILTSMSTNKRTPKKMLFSPMKTPTHSPMVKRVKLSSPVLPIINITNLPVTPSSVRRSTRKRPTNAFHYRYPTMHLPNFVYDQFLRDIGRYPEDVTGSHVKKTPSTSCRKKLNDYWDNDKELTKSEKFRRTRFPSSTEFTGSLCSEVVTEEQRVLNNSPRKLILKKTPQKLGSQLDNLADADSRKRRKSNRNLLDYFSKA